MNLHEITRDYIESMLSEQPGRKALILDKQTLGKYARLAQTVAIKGFLDDLANTATFS